MTNGSNTARCRFMRMLVFFDLPVVTCADKKEYRHFHTYMVKDGYLMVQESVYSKLVTNYGACELEMDKLKKNKPKKGLVQCLIITENQFAGITYICGESPYRECNTTDRLVII